MRERHIRPPATIAIDTQTTEHDVWDSSSFDRIDQTLLQETFKTQYSIHLNFLTKLVTSRLAFDSAADNLQKAAVDALGGGVEIIEPKQDEAVDQAFNIAIRLYAYNHVLSLFFDDDTKREMLTLLGGASLKTTPPAGNRALGVRGDLSNDIEQIEKRLEEKLGRALRPEQREPPRRARDEDTRNGAIRRRNRKTP